MSTSMCQNLIASEFFFILPELEDPIPSTSKNDNNESMISKTLSSAISNISLNTDAKNGKIFQNCTFFITVLM
jgi:hypothetical protein